MPHVELRKQPQNADRQEGKRVQTVDMLMRIMADSQLNPHGG